MVYVEYNNSKRKKTYYDIEITESDTPNEHILLAFSPFQEIYPINNLFPKKKSFEEDENYLLSFLSIKNYYNNKYCLFYNDKYYLFTADIRKNDALYFKEENGEYVLQFVGDVSNKVILPVYDTLDINKSGNEITFSTVKADFGSRTMADLPMAYQEIRIWDGVLKDEYDLTGATLIFTGFLDNATVSQKHTANEECDIELSLLSPMNLTTKRCVTIIGTYYIKDLLNEVFAPLINDGYEFQTVMLTNTQIYVNYYLETIEKVMNDLANKLNLFWTINEKKGIIVYDIDKLFAKEPVMTIDDKNHIEGTYELKPTIKNNNYFNTINIKNARIYRTQRDKALLDVMKLINEEELELVNPIDFGVNGASRVCQNNETDTCTILKIVNSSNTTLYDIKYENGEIVLPNGVVFSDEDTENATLILKRDSFFKSLVVGFEWKDTTQNLKTIESDTVLKYEIFRYYNSYEINKCADYLTDSGIIEETIDVNEAWFTYNEVVEYCNNLMNANSNNTTGVEIEIDENYNLKIGDLLRINQDAFFINGDFIITEIQESIYGYNGYTCNIVAQNNKFQENYIDIFRKANVEQEESKYNDLNIINHISEEIIEKHGVYEEV